MALGGGNFLTQNKVMPGSYINFVSQAKASATLSDRGIVALALPLDWGDEIIEITAGEFFSESLEILGYSYTDPEMLPLRELFMGAKSAIIYRLNEEGLNAKLETDELYAQARYPGLRGNALSISAEKVGNVSGSDNEGYMVYTRLGETLVDKQMVSRLSELIDNPYLTFSYVDDAPLWEISNLYLTGGENGNLTDNAYGDFLDAMDNFSFHVLAYPGQENDLKKLFASYTKNMREEYGRKFQTVLFQHLADHEGIISVENEVLKRAGISTNPADLIYWTAGMAAGLPINRSLTNKKYDGAYLVDTNMRQAKLIQGLKEGRFLFHKVGHDVHVLDDINTFISITDEMGEDFKDNQVLRILDQIGNDIASLFKDRYLGKVQNDAAGRVAFWNDLINYFNDLRQIRAINHFDGADITVEIGKDRKSVMVTTTISPVSVMTKLYMTILVQ